MDTDFMSAAERVGPAFSVEGMLRARAHTRQAIRDIASRIEPGMLEEDAVAMAQKLMADAGLAKSWHPTRVRFGANTIKAMKQPSVPGVILQPDDIFFLDIAPRFEHWEGDGGASFAVGADPAHARCARDAEALFHRLRQRWLREGLTGQALYADAVQAARAMGWELDLDLPGHRISDFPHAAIHTGSLAALDASPSPMRWVLEIHLCDPAGRFGAFFEDLLLGDEYYG